MHLDINAWYADDGNIVGNIDQIKKAYRIIVDEEPSVNFALVKSKKSLWCPTMETERLRDAFDCSLDGDTSDKPEKNRHYRLTSRHRHICRAANRLKFA